MVFIDGRRSTDRVALTETSAVGSTVQVLQALSGGLLVYWLEDESMNARDRAWVATRKGLFELRDRARCWHIEKVSFLAEPVTMLLPPDDQGRMLAALNLGHFGVKVHASPNAGVSWQFVALALRRSPSRPARVAGAGPDAGDAARAAAACYLRSLFTPSANS